jgi:hypothetical protein
VPSDVTSRVVASIHAEKNRTGNTYRVLWREDGRQRSLTFENLPAAGRFKTLLEDRGPDEALRIIELDEIGRHVPNVTEWLYAHIDNNRSRHRGSGHTRDHHRGRRDPARRPVGIRARRRHAAGVGRCALPLSVFW